MNKFQYVGVLLKLMYDIELDEEDIEELGLVAWELIGNKIVRLYRCLASIDPSDLSVTLPCNAIQGTGADGGIVEAVTSNYEDWNRYTNTTSNGDFYSSFVELSIESEKYFKDNLYIPGKLLKYNLVGDKLYFSHNYGTINILYKGILADEDGLPELSDKEALAIATYIAYILKFKEGLKTNNSNISNLAILLLNLWLKLCDLARVTYLNLNDMNLILDIKTSWGRHTYNKTGTKPLR